jgi:hypothetical protein
MGSADTTYMGCIAADPAIHYLNCTPSAIHKYKIHPYCSGLQLQYKYMYCLYVLVQYTPTRNTCIGLVSPLHSRTKSLYGLAIFSTSAMVNAVFRVLKALLNQLSHTWGVLSLNVGRSFRIQ